jgi:hypothetical protein
MLYILKIKYGEIGKASGHYLINLNQIRYIMYHDVNEGVRGQGAESKAYAEVYFTNGRPDMMLDEEGYKALVQSIDNIINMEGK